MSGIDAYSDDELSFVEVGEFDALSITVKPKPKEKYPAKVHARNVAKLLGVEKGLIYLRGESPKLFEDSDQPQPFRQRRYFYYLSGIDFPGCALSYNIKSDKITAFIPPPTTGREVIYNGSSPTIEEVEANYDFDKVDLTTHLDEHISEYVNQFIRDFGQIFVLDESQLPKVPLGSFVHKFVKETLDVSLFNPSKLKEAMDTARMRKTDYELKMIRKACDISSAAHINVLRELKHLKNETEIESVFIATCLSKHAKQQAYGVIAGAGENASVLHYMANSASLAGRQVVCLDAACEWDVYAADITRTFPISGEWSTEAKYIYDIVADMQDSCIEMIKPGADFKDINLHANKVAIVGLMGLRILVGDYEELYESGVVGAFFPHGLGHFMGLEVHDVGNTSATKAQSDSIRKKPGMSRKAAGSVFPRILEPRMVVTVEPGIYFSRYAMSIYKKDSKLAKYIDMDVVENYYAVGGVRIEDDILVTENGYENLTRAPKGDEALKIINEGWGKSSRYD